MKKITSLFFILIIIISTKISFAQNTSGTFMINSKGTINGTIPDSLLFVLRDFSIGTLILKDGSNQAGKININTYNQEIWFIDAKRDTLTLSKEYEVSMVKIQNTLYKKIHDDYAAILSEDGDYKFGIIKKLSIKEPPKEAAYGGTSDISSVNSISSINDGTGSHLLNRYKNAPYVFSVIPIIIKNSRVYYPTKKNLKKIFPKNKDEIEIYLKHHKIDFYNAHQVKNTYNYFIKKQNN